MKKAKIIALLLCAVLACVGVFALSGCGGNGGGDTSAADAKPSTLVGTRWNLYRMVMKGEEKTVEEYIASDAKYQEGDQFILEVKDDMNLYMRTYRDGKLFEEQQVLYTYKNGEMQVSSPNSSCKVEGDTLTMLWNNGANGFIFKKA